jgi:peroxiredoxin
MISRLALVLLLTAAAFAQHVNTTVRTAPDFGDGGVWLDQGAPVPHHIGDYKGKVVLIDFWEYTCINCIRDFAVLKQWYTKYHQYGLDIIGVHFGEFNIGFDVNNVREGAEHYHLPWPVLADLKGATWKAYDAQGWPDRFLIDQQGKIVMSIFGEGDDAQMEQKIRELLAKSNPEVLKVPLGSEESAFNPKCGVTTEETYVGGRFGRSSVMNMGDHKTGDEVDFLPPHSPHDGGVMLAGRWKIAEDGVTTKTRNDGAEIRYHARSVYAVMSLDGAKQVKVYLSQDGDPLPKDSAGSDVKFDDKGAYVEVTQGRMYYLVRSPRFTAHLLALNPDAPGLTLHSFTFGNDCQLQDQP